MFGKFKESVKKNEISFIEGKKIKRGEVEKTVKENKNDFNCK